MHELSLMERLQDIVLAQAAAAGATEVRAIRLRIGELAGVEPQALQWAAAVVLADSPAAGARLQIESVPAGCLCQSCAAPFLAPGGNCTCPRCGRIAAGLSRGLELELVGLEVA